MWLWFVYFFKQKTSYEMRISVWSSDGCSSDLVRTEGYMASSKQRLARDGPRQNVFRCDRSNGDDDEWSGLDQRVEGGQEARAELRVSRHAIEEVRGKDGAVRKVVHKKGMFARR